MNTKTILAIFGILTTVTGIGFVAAEMKGNYQAKLECIEQTEKLKDENTNLKLDYIKLAASTGFDNKD